MQNNSTDSGSGALPFPIQETIGRVVLRYPQTIQVFEDYNIDYLVNAFFPVSSICTQQGLNLNALTNALKSACSRQSWDNQEWFLSDKVSEIIDYIIKEFHERERREIESIKELLNEILSFKENPNYALLLEMKECFLETAAGLIRHMDREEKHIFANLRRLDQADISPKESEKLLSLVSGPLNHMDYEHGMVLDFLKKITGVINRYKHDENTRENIYEIIHRFKVFQHDLKRHLFYENFILYNLVLRKPFF